VIKITITFAAAAAAAASSRRTRVTCVSNRLNHQALKWQNRAPEPDYAIQLQGACSRLLLIPDRMAGQPDDLMWCKMQAQI